MEISDLFILLLGYLYALYTYYTNILVLSLLSFTKYTFLKTGYFKEAVLKDFYDKDDSKAIYVIHI